MIIYRIATLTGVEQDIQIYFNYAGKIIGGLIPYRDFVVEYPPGAVPFFVLPRIFTDNLLIYRQLFAAEMMLVDLAGLILIIWYCGKRGLPEHTLYFSGLYYTAVPAVLGLMAYQRFDMVPAVLVLGAVILFGLNRPVSAWVLTGLGFAVKLYPVILAPLFLFIAYKQKNLRRVAMPGICAAISAVAALWLPFLIKAGLRFLVFLLYHGKRGIQLESLYSSILLAAHFFGYRAAPRFSYGSWNLDSSLSPLLARLSFFIMLFLLMGVLVHSRSVMGRPGWTKGDLPRLAVLLVLAFIIGGKVFSPQYLLWVSPLLAICYAENPKRLLPAGLFALITLLTFLIFPTNYQGLINMDLGPVFLILLRNILVAVLFYLLIRNGNSSRETRKIRDT